MRKGFYVVLALLVALSLGIVFIHCGDDDDACTIADCTNEGAECCEACTDLCAAGEVCWVEGEECTPPCCETENAAANEWWIDISGMALDLTTQAPVKVAIAPISPTDALTNENPVHLDDVMSGDDGTFQSDCFEVTTVSLGCVALVDDEGFDGTAGTYFPAASGVIGWDKNSEKWCAKEAKVFAFPNTVVGMMDQLPDIDSAADGFVLGFVVDATFTPIEGVVVTLDTGTALAKVYYPSADLQDFTTGTATSAAGIFVLPAVNYSGTIITVTGNKTGMTFDDAQASSHGGLCYFTYITGKPE